MQNKLARDAAAARERDLQAQVAELRERLAGGAASAGGSKSDGSGDAREAARLKRELKNVQQVLAAAEDDAAALRASTARLERESRALKVPPLRA